MPKGPNHEVRPADPVSAAVLVGRIATGQVEDPRKPPLTPERRSEIARNAARARWAKHRAQTDNVDA